MKVSTRTHYGLRVMSYLACHHAQGPVSLREVAVDQALPLKYLEHLCAALKAAGLIKSVRGAGGGYALVLEPDAISLWDIYRVLEGELTTVDCLQDGHGCRSDGDCPTREVWAQMSEAVKQVLEQSKLADVARDGRCNCLVRKEE